MQNKIYSVVIMKIRIQMSLRLHHLKRNSAPAAALRGDLLLQVWAAAAEKPQKYVVFQYLNLNNKIMEMRNLLLVHNSDSLIINQSSWRAACSLGGHTAIVLLQK